MAPFGQRRDPSGEEFEAQREHMVEAQLRRRGISDERVLAAMGSVPRELFVPEAERRRAYADGALPIGHGQTISQPWIVAAIAEALELDGPEHVLEVGAGSGYSTAVLAQLARSVVAVERVPELAAAARSQLERLGVENVEILEGDASGGLPERGPFGGIAVHATAPGHPRGLLRQLEVGAVLVAPIATEGADMLTAFRRVGPDEFERREIAACRFVPLVGNEGYPEA